MDKYNLREIALKIVYEVLEKGGYSNIVLKRHLDNTMLDERDKSLITEIAYGTIRKKITIDYIIETYSKIKLKKVSVWILNLMRIAVYQIIFMDKVPVFASCGESVKLGKKYGHQAAVNYMNGVLRNIARNKENIPYPDEEKDKSFYLEKKYSYPKWLIDMWNEEFGAEFTIKMLEYEDKRRNHNVTIRVNQLKIKKEQLREILEKEGLQISDGIYFDEALIINGSVRIDSLETYLNGLFQVQSESSMLAVHVLEPKPYEFIIDVCSAPGGKVSYMAQMMHQKGHILARDIHEHKLKLIKQNTNRLGIDIINVEKFDAEQIDSNLLGKADRVLADVPCTGYGVIGKKPDILINRTQEDICNIVKMQHKILQNSSMYVKPGGVLVYSTCSIEYKENQEVVFKFLEKNKDFFLSDITEFLPKNMVKDEAYKGYVTLYPHIDKTDGFFIAKLCRKEIKRKYNG